MEFVRFIVSSVVSAVINGLSFRSATPVQNILIIKLDHLGDLVCSFEALYNIREKFPLAQLTLITGDWNFPLLKNSNMINEIIAYNSPIFSRSRKTITDIRGRIALYKKLRKINWSIVVGLREDYFTIFLSLFIFPKRRLDRGTLRVKMKLKKFTSNFYPHENYSQHEIDVNFNIVKPIIDSRQKQLVPFLFDEDENNWIDNFFEAHRFTKNRYAVIHPGASWEFKRWSPKNFQRVGQFIFNEYGFKSVIVGILAEKEIGLAITPNNEHIFIDAIGKLSLRQTILLINNAAIAICNDSAPMHIAAVAGVRTIGLMGPAETEKFSPRGDRSLFLHKKTACHPCKQIKCFRPATSCVNLITHQEVNEKIKYLLST